mmetsp:Transcript_89894/g.254755  ORF Transcript_89894/g.254755 Transcript_89894/m.254755 type:complete len:259 (-) Transcript_89894:586-1362(-)
MDVGSSMRSPYGQLGRLSPFRLCTRTRVPRVGGEERRHVRAIPTPQCRRVPSPANRSGCSLPHLALEGLLPGRPGDAVPAGRGLQAEAAPLAEVGSEGFVDAATARACLQRRLAWCRAFLAHELVEPILRQLDDLHVLEAVVILSAGVGRRDADRRHHFALLLEVPQHPVMKGLDEGVERVLPREGDQAMPVVHLAARGRRQVDVDDITRDLKPHVLHLGSQHVLGVPVRQVAEHDGGSDVAPGLVGGRPRGLGGGRR